MKVPVYDEPQVAPSALPDANFHATTQGAFGNPGAAFEGISKSLGQLEHSAIDAYNQESKKADDAAAADATAQQQMASNTLLADLRQSKGEAAMAKSGQVYQELQRVQQEHLDQLHNDRQKEAFTRAAREIYLTSAHQVENYVGEQKLAADEATTQAHIQSSLTSVANDYTNEALAAKQYGLVNQTIRQLQLSKDDGDAKMARFRADLSRTRIDSALAAGDWKYAQDLYSATRDEFGEAGGALEHRIEVKKNLVLGDQMAQDFIQKSMDASGRPAEGMVWQEVDKQPPGEFRKALEEQVQTQLSRSMRAYQQVEGDRLGRVLEGVESSGGQLDKSTDDFQLLSPENKARAVERQKTLNRTDRGEQRQMDREELARFSAIPVEDRPAVNIGQQFPSASPTARYQMQALQNSAKQAATKGQLMPMREFDDQVRGATEQLALPKKDGADLKAQMDAWYLQQEQKSGKAPTRTEADAELARRLQHNPGSWGVMHLGSGYRFQSIQEGTEGDFKPGEEAGPYEKVRQGAGNAAPQAPAVPAAPAVHLVPVTRNGVTKYWDGKGWVDHP